MTPDPTAVPFSVPLSYLARADRPGLGLRVDFENDGPMAEFLFPVPSPAAPDAPPDGTLLLANARRARRIRRGAPPRRLCDKSGFAECFDALTGAGQRDRAYTWTASIFFLFASEFA